MKAIKVLEGIKEGAAVSRKELDEAIAELEALENRSCAGCKNSWEPNNQIIYRYYCERNKAKIHGDFCCKYWEEK